MRKLNMGRGIMLLLLVTLFLNVSGLPVYAAEPEDTLAQQAAVNSYDRYLQSNGELSLASFNALDPYGVYILTEAGVTVSQWVYEERNLKDSVVSLISDTKLKEADSDPGNDVNAKYVAYQYLAARGLEENGLAGDLLQILVNRQTANGDGAFFQGAWSQYTNLPVFDALSRAGMLENTAVEKGIDYILSLKSGSYFSDLMSTTQAVRSLAALKVQASGYRTAEVDAAISEGLAWVRSNIQEDGSLVEGMDDTVTDTAEAIVALAALGQDPAAWQHETTGKSPVDYMLSQAKNADGSFGNGNMGANIWALDAYVRMGAVVSGDTALKIRIAPAAVEIAVREAEDFTAAAFLADGTNTDVTAEAEWSVNNSEIAVVSKEGGKVAVSRTASGDFLVTAVYRLVSDTVTVGTGAAPDEAGITVRIEGPVYTILPDTVISAPPGSGYTEILLAGQAANGYTVEEAGGFVKTINGLGAPDFYWMTAPWQENGYNNGDSFVMSGNGSVNPGNLEVSMAKTEPGKKVTVAVTDGEGRPVEGAGVIYYTAQNRTAPATAGTTGVNGQLVLDLDHEGTYYLAADKPNTASWPAPDNGLVRTVARQLLVREKNSGGGGSGSLDIRVNVTVKGKNNKIYFSGGVSLAKNDAYGVTALGALDKTGLSYDYETIDYIHTIAGLEPQGLNGWMYKVNGVIPDKPAADYGLSQGDDVLWFYSTDPSNMSGGGTGSGLQAGQSATEEETAAETITAVATLTPQTYQELVVKKKGITLGDKGAAVSIGLEALQTTEITSALADKNASLVLGAREISSAEKLAILAQAPLGESTALLEIGGKIVDLSAEIKRVAETGQETLTAIQGFSEPVKVTLDLSELNIGPEDRPKLTAVRYEKDERDKITLLKLGGDYDPLTKKFTFYTEKFSLYGVVKARQLVKISLGINMLTAVVNGNKEFTDTPPMLINNRTMAPLRFVAESFGAGVSWLEKERAVEIKMDGKTVKLAIDQTLPGHDTPVAIINGRTMVPLRYLSEIIGARVIWFPTGPKVELVK